MYVCLCIRLHEFCCVCSFLSFFLDQFVCCAVVAFRLLYNMFWFFSNILEYLFTFICYSFPFLSPYTHAHTRTHTEADKQRTRRRLLLRSCVFCLVSFHFSAWSFVVFMLRVVSVGERKREEVCVPCLCVCLLVCARVLCLCRCKCEWTRSMSALRRSSLRSMGRNKQLRQQQQQQQQCRA